jgi:hypothetical protein
MVCYHSSALAMCLFTLLEFVHSHVSCTRRTYVFSVLCKDQDLSKWDSTSNTCLVVSGELTIYTNPDSADADSDKQLVLDALIRLMDEGAFVDSSNGITRVSFIQLNPTPSQTEKTDQVKPEDLDGPRVRLGVYVATAGALFALIGVAAYTRRSMNTDDVEDSTARTPNSY